MTFDNVLADIFNRNAEARFESVEEERVAIAAAKQGDNEATVSLLYAYASAIRNAVARFTSETPEAKTDPEELRSAALLGFFEAIKSFDADKHERLAGIVRTVLMRTMREEFITPSAFTVPDRTLTRFYEILRHADGNVYEAAALAPKYSMTKETFLAVLSAVRNVNSYEGITSAEDEFDPYAVGGQSSTGPRDVDAKPLWDNSAAEEDAELVKAAFEAVDDLEEEVCRMSYGFTDYEPVPDAEIGHRLGLSRQKTQRTRSSALGKMRAALAVA